MSDPVRVMETERDALFDELLDEALASREVKKGLDHKDAPSEKDLRAAAKAQRAPLLGEARRQEEEYRQAGTEIRTRRRRRRAEGAAGMSGAVALVVMLAGYAVATYWNAELKNAYGAVPHRHVDVWAVVGRGLADAAALGVIAWVLGVMVASAVLRPGYLLSKWRLGKKIAIAIRIVAIRLFPFEPPRRGSPTGGQGGERQPGRRGGEGRAGRAGRGGRQKTSPR